MCSSCASNIPVRAEAEERPKSSPACAPAMSSIRLVVTEAEMRMPSASPASAANACRESRVVKGGQ